MIDAPPELLTPRGDPLPHTAFSRIVDGALRAIARATSWLWAVLLATIVANVTLRYAFGAGRIEFEELQWHLYAVGFLVGLGYCVECDAHVRVDVVRDRLPARLRAWIELYGIVLLVLPFVALVVAYGVPFAWEAWRSGEISSSPGGLPHRWLIKSALPLAFLLLAAASLSRLSRVVAFLFAPGDSAEQDTDAGRPGAR